MVYLLTNIKHSLISGYFTSLFFRISAEAVGVVEVVEAVHLSGQDYLIIRVYSVGSLLRLLVWWRL